jgi:hypothetical protein
MLSHTELQYYYANIFALAQHHKYSISEIENLIVYERDIYIGLLINYLESKKNNN